MCGINLILDKKGTIPAMAIQAMTLATTHRGPDATNFYTTPHRNGNIYFGQNRLKIIDLSDQANGPFISEDGRYILVYNGEVYNFQELRFALLQRGYRFRTQSDTEVILQLILLEGPRAFAHLNGMFALAFYDTEKQQLWLVRDRFGIKPLFYTENENYLIVSSEIKAIHQSSLVPKELNTHQLNHYLLYKHAAKPQTFYKNIKELKEGTFLLHENGKSHLHSYLHQAPIEHRHEKENTLVQRVETLLSESLQKHLIAHVPVGLFLSGGIDSTLLLALLHTAGHRQFPAFTISYQNTPASFGTQDSKFARLAAEQYQAQYHPFNIDDTLLQETDAFVQHLNQPVADGAALLTSFLAQQVKPYIKVALSGAGADEFFAGYNRHQAFYEYLQNPGKVSFFKNFVKPLAFLLPTGFNHPLRKKFVLMRKLAYKMQASPGQTFRNFTAMDWRLQQLLIGTPEESYAEETNINHNRDWLHWCLHHDQHQYLISDILAITDQASMRHSLEVRTPFLENHLHLYLSGIDTDLLFRNGPKWVLKAILAKHKGKDFLTRSKEGFGMPLAFWLRKPQNQYIVSELRNSQQVIFEYIDFTKTQQLLQIHLRGRHDFSTEIWALIVLAKWLQHNFT